MTATTICKSHVFKTVIGIIRSPDFKILHIVLQISHLSATLEKKGVTVYSSGPVYFSYSVQLCLNVYNSLTV